MAWIKREHLTIEQQAVINYKFNIDLDSLEKLGEGVYGQAFKIDDKSVLKITEAAEEAAAITSLVSSGVILEPGFATVLPNDLIYIRDDIWAYRTELLITAKEAFKWALSKGIFGKPHIEYFKNKTNELYQFLPIIPGFSKYADNTVKMFLDIPIFTTLMLSLLEAAENDIYLWDIHLDNLGFRPDENNNPAIDAGFVAFDTAMN